MRALEPFLHRGSSRGDLRAIPRSSRLYLDASRICMRCVYMCFSVCVMGLFNIFPLHDARRRRRTPAKYSQLVPQLDDFITPASSECRGRPMPRGLVRLSSFSLSLSSFIPLTLPPAFLHIAFFLPLHLSRRPPFQRSANAARDDNERRNPAGISARDKRTLTAYEQASALMVPTLHRRPTRLPLSLPLSLFFHHRAALPERPPACCCCLCFLFLSRIYRRTTGSFISHPYPRMMGISLGFLIKNIARGLV